jgi:hypothetical protein
VQLVLLPSCASLVLLSLLRPRTSPIGMVRIRHPNLFMDKRDIIWAKMPTFCDKLFSACRKFIFIFFYAFAKISLLFIFAKSKCYKNLHNSRKNLSSYEFSPSA